MSDPTAFDTVEDSISATRGTRGRRTVLIAVLAIAGIALSLVIALSATVWAAWGTSLQGRLGAGLESRLTPTATRTPRPVTPAASRTVVEPLIVAFTPTSSPTPVPTAEPAPGPLVTADPFPADLAAVAAHYGIDPARRFIVIDEKTQRMKVWDPGHPVREMLVSTGDPAQNLETPGWYGLVGDYWGTFHAYGTYADEGWYLFDWNGAILIHSAPYWLVDGKKVYKQLDALGNYPASLGCIRLAPEDARWFTEWKPKGVPLVILARE